jgi:hypothetical protein
MVQAGRQLKTAWRDLLVILIALAAGIILGGGAGLVACDLAGDFKLWAVHGGRPRAT